MPFSVQSFPTTLGNLQLARVADFRVLLQFASLKFVYCLLSIANCLHSY